MRPVEVSTTGWSAMLEEADLEESAALVAVTFTVCAALIEFGAVKSPALEMDPTAGLIDHLTAVLEEPVTARDMAKRFVRARSADVDEILETLCAMGKARRGKAVGTFLP